ncbi:phage terminase small subunit [Caminicella sporogenes DSM 14501]|uniref:Phage terminase small subunit n=1 Tax=Caminicella sporogenes DSM 14501 TaxID=1121266 RepID=A0A1M6MYU1_9FIRM|nr:terminase small subunit [Caminicella sporogenes]RKD22444.1 terminase [Caminicella sporogenes]SHJ88493.1 phage terminase small subunit [Caminicella sporogenes DSM 14501]
MKLTEKQKRFCDYYIETGNATEAAIRAGYSEKTARFIGAENLTKPNIKTYIDKKLKELEDKRIAKAEEVLKYLTSVMRGEEKEEVVVTENIGDFESKARIIKKQVSAKERIKAAELLGKRYAMWTERQQIDGVATIQIIDDIEEEDKNEKN